MDAQLIARFVVDEAILRGTYNYLKAPKWDGKSAQRSRSGFSTAMESTVASVFDDEEPMHLSLVSVAAANQTGPCLMKQNVEMPTLSANPKLEDYTALLLRVHEGAQAEEDFAVDPATRAMTDFKVKCFNYGKSLESKSRLIRTGEGMLSVIPDDDAARASASNILAEKSHSAFWKDVENLVEVSDELREDVSTIAFDLQDLRRWVHYKLAEIEKQKLDPKPSSRSSKSRGGRVSSPRSQPTLRRGMDYTGRYLARPLRARTPPAARISII